MAQRVGETEYGGVGGVMQPESKGHRLDADRRGVGEQRMLLAKQMQNEKGGLVNRTVSPDGTITITPITEEQVRRDYERQ